MAIIKTLINGTNSGINMEWRKKESAETQELCVVDVFRWAYLKTISGEVKYYEVAVPFCPDYFIYDVKADVESHKQDQTYALDTLLRTNIRRGLSIIVKYAPLNGRRVNPDLVIKHKGKDCEMKETYWARKGFQKFFELSLDHLKETELASVSEAIRKQIFDPLEKSIEHSIVDVVKTQKANGENAQISYFWVLDAWIIASRTFSIIARSLEDLKNFDVPSSEVAELIAEEWFRVISEWPESKLNKFKNEVKGLTLIGDYTGNPNCQHLLRYEKVSIQFFAVVENSSSGVCMPPLGALTLFKKYNLDHVKFEKLGSYSELHQLYLDLSCLFKEVSEGSLETIGEGVVLYFVKNSEPKKTFELENKLLHTNEDCSNTYFKTEFSRQQVVSMCKVKTVEYKLLRKIRDKCELIAKGKKQHNPFDAFVRYSKSVVEEAGVIKPLSYYHDLAKVAIQEVKNNPRQLETIKNNFLDFVKELSAPKTTSLFKQVAVICPPGYLKDSEISYMSNQLKSRLLDYSWEENKYKLESGLELYIVNNLPRVTSKFDKSCLLVVAGYTETGKSISLNNLKEMIQNRTLPSHISHWERASNLESKLTNQFNGISQLKSFKCVEENLVDLQDLSLAEIIDKIKLTAEVSLQEPTNEVVLVVPMGIPGIGKSHICPYMKTISEDSGWHFSSISSDLITEEVMSEHTSKNPKLEKKLLFQKSYKKSKKLFEQTLSNLLAQKLDKHLIYLDKNHPPNAIYGLRETLNRSLCKETNLKMIALVPECKNFIELTSSYLELSESLIYQCMLRLKNRVNHPTLDGSLEDKLKVFLIILSFYKNFSFESCISLGFYKVIKFPFTDETVTPSQEFVELLHRNLKGTINLKAIARFIQKDPNTPTPTEQLPYLAQKLTEVIPKNSKGHRKSPLYLGIDFKDYFGTSVLPLVVSCLHQLNQLFPENSAVSNDLSQLTNTSSRAFSESSMVSEKWSFTSNLHLTTFYIGKKLRPYGDFPEEMSVNCFLTHIVYVPEKIICAKAIVKDQGVKLNTKNPHVTLLKGKSKSRFSNEVLEALEDHSGVHHSEYTIRDERVSVFSMELSPFWYLKGVTKKYYE